MSENKQAYVILGVTGPNEYENNVNNNWYTNYIAKWCLKYTLQVEENICSKKINEEEIKKWKHIIDNTYLPIFKSTNVFLQQDGFLDKEQLKANDIPLDEKTTNQHWSWDKFCVNFYWQADVLQGIYFLKMILTIKQ